MIGLLADENAEGLLGAVVAERGVLGLTPFLADITFSTFNEAGIDYGADDRLIWSVCRQVGYVLLTLNRNQDGPNSLEAVLRESVTPLSLPVLTLGRADRRSIDTNYMREVAKGLAEVLYSLAAGEGKYRGVGRLFLPLALRP